MFCQFSLPWNRISTTPSFRMDFSERSADSFNIWLPRLTLARRNMFMISRAAALSCEWRKTNKFFFPLRLWIQSGVDGYWICHTLCVDGLRAASMIGRNLTEWMTFSVGEKPLRPKWIRWKTIPPAAPFRCLCVAVVGRSYLLSSEERSSCRLSSSTVQLSSS